MKRPRGCGIGLRKEHEDAVVTERPRVSFLEVPTERVLVAGGRPRQVLERVRRDYPVSFHGASMSLGSAEPLDRRYLALLGDLVDRIQPALISDHLAWTSLGGHHSHDLLPLPYTEEAVAQVAANVREVQDLLGHRILIENIPTYLEWKEATLGEVDFLVAVLEEADCDLLLDVSSLYVNSQNHGLDPVRALDLLPPRRVKEIHVSGHDDRGDLVLDTRDQPVSDDVWSLYALAVERFGPVPTVVEWDARIPPLDVLLAEARRAEAIQRRVSSPHDSRRPCTPSEPFHAVCAV